MAEPLLDAEYLARHAARRDGSMPPVEMTFEVTAPSAEPETPTPSAPAPDAATPPAEATGASIAAAAPPGGAEGGNKEATGGNGLPRRRRQVCERRRPCDPHGARARSRLTAPRRASHRGGHGPRGHHATRRRGCRH